MITFILQNRYSRIYHWSWLLMWMSWYIENIPEKLDLKEIKQKLFFEGRLKPTFYAVARKAVIQTRSVDLIDKVDLTSPLVYTTALGTAFAIQENVVAVRANTETEATQLIERFLKDYLQIER